VGSPHVTALLGASYILQIDQIIPVSNYKSHESFNRNLENDIAILNLARGAILNDFVGILRLPRKSQASDVFTDRIATIAGWGDTGERNQQIPNEHLRFVKSQVISNTACLLRYPLYIKSSNICTNTALGTPCDGDEGGGLTIVENDRMDTQIGIFSYQYSRGCERGRPGKMRYIFFNHKCLRLIYSFLFYKKAVYTRITSYLVNV
jgi:chymotrypsin C